MKPPHFFLDNNCLLNIVDNTHLIFIEDGYNRKRLHSARDIALTLITLL